MKPKLALLRALLLRDLFLGCLLLCFLLCHAGLSPPSCGLAIVGTPTTRLPRGYRSPDRFFRASWPGNLGNQDAGSVCLTSREPLDSGNQRFLAPFFLAPFFFAAFFFAAFFFAILPPWNVAAQLGSQNLSIATGGLSGPPSYQM